MLDEGPSTEPLGIAAADIGNAGRYCTPPNRWKPGGDHRGVEFAIKVMVILAMIWAVIRVLGCTRGA